MLEQWHESWLRWGQDAFRQILKRACNTLRQQILLAPKVFVKSGSRYGGSSNDFSYRDLIVLSGAN